MGNPEEGKPAPAAAAPAAAAPSGRPQCKYADKCTRKNPDHFKEESHPGDADWGAPAAAGYAAGAAPAAPFPGQTTEEDKGFMGAAAGGAAAFGGMKLTGAGENVGFFGKAAVVAGVAIAGSLLQDHLSGGKKGKQTKWFGGKKKKKKKKGKKSRGLDDLPEEDEFESGSGEDMYETDSDQEDHFARTGRTKCKYADKCYQKDAAHKAEFSHPGDTDF